MTIPRLLGLVAIFGVLGVAVVLLRADQVRRSSEIQKLQLEQIGLQRKLKIEQLNVARLRNPAMVQDRAERFAVPLRPPYDEPKRVLPADESWVADQ